MSVQDLQDELIEDVLVAASALWDLYREKKERERVRTFHSQILPGPHGPDPSCHIFTMRQKLY